MRYVNSTATELPVRVRLVGHRTVNGQHHVAIGDSLALFATTDELSDLLDQLCAVLGEVRVRDVRVILGVAQ